MRRTGDIDIALQTRPAGVERQRWLYTELRAAILNGRLTSGSRLPASRELARRLGLARGTVLAVYDQLAAEGYLCAKVGQGSFVSRELPEMRLETETPRLAGTATQKAVISPPLSQRGRLLARTPFQREGRRLPARAFRPNQPDLAAFPLVLWSRITASSSRLLKRDGLTDGEAGGFRPLRTVIAEHLRLARGITCQADNVMILGSMQQIFDLCARLFLDPGDEAWLEDPGYPGARMVLEAAGARVVGIPVDGGGMDVAAGCTLAPDARLVYVTAGRQAPLGPPLALERRLALISWAGKRGAVVIEDDYDSEYRFEGAPLAAMKSLDSADCIVYCGTFSKLLFPALRLAYAVVPDSLVDPVAGALSLTCRHAPLTVQATLHEFIAEGHFGRHVRRMRMLYAERARTLQDSARTYLAGLLTLPPITMGLDTPAYLPPLCDDTHIARLAAEAGIESRPLSFYSLTRQTPPGLLLGFAAINPDEIKTGIQTLARVLEYAVSTTPGPGAGR